MGGNPYIQPHRGGRRSEYSSRTDVSHVRATWHAISFCRVCLALALVQAVLGKLACGAHRRISLQSSRFCKSWSCCRAVVMCNPVQLIQQHQLQELPLPEMGIRDCFLSSHPSRLPNVFPPHHRSIFATRVHCLLSYVFMSGGQPPPTSRINLMVTTDSGFPSLPLCFKLPCFLYSSRQGPSCGLLPEPQDNATTDARGPGTLFLFQVLLLHIISFLSSLFF